MLGFPHLVGAALLAAGLTGCSLLDMLLGVAPFDPDDPGFSFPPLPTAGAAFTDGLATVELSGAAGSQTIVLDRLTGASSFDTDYGSRAIWTNGAGFYLTVYGFPEELLPGGAYLMIDRIVDSEHWVLLDGSRCIATMDPAATPGPGNTLAASQQGVPNRMSGTAVCRGLRWADYFSTSSLSGFPTAIPREPPFDAEISFEAH